MCGIVGYIGKNNCKKTLIDGLKRIQNRGYDSVGISLLKNKKINTYKFASTHTNDSLRLLENHVLNNDTDSCIGIGHTRWATHGSKCDLNAHPHTDKLNRISIVHNGIIENYLELKSKLIKENYTFKTETDTEVIAILISKYFDECNSIELSIQKCVSDLRGSWALCILFNENPNSMWLTRNGSPLLLGVENDYAMISSENSGFNDQIKKYIVIDNNDIIKVTYNNNKIEYSCDIERYKINNHIATGDNNLPDEYHHWMLKEIMEQPLCINRALNNGGRISGNTTVKLGGLDSFKNQLENIEHLILLGCGTSYHAGLWSLDQFKQYDIFNTVSCFDGAEFNILDIPKKGKSAIILLSQSGETKDLHRCIDIAKSCDLITIGVVNVHDSMIARETDCGVYLNAGRENSVASTKSFTNQCVILSMIAIWFSQIKGTYINKRLYVLKDLMKLEYDVKATIENIENQIKQLVEKISSTSLFVLGKGECEAIAREGALKIKEVSYLHAEGYSSSALKHGPFALIQDNTPIIIIDISKKYHDKNLNACNETLSRGSLNIIITNDTSYYENINIPQENIIIIEYNETYNSLIANICIQIISYYLSIKFNYNPDFPRNLAKVVTVE